MQETYTTGHEWVISEEPKTRLELLSALVENVLFDSNTRYLEKQEIFEALDPYVDSIRDGRIALKQSQQDLEKEQAMANLAFERLKIIEDNLKEDSGFKNIPLNFEILLAKLEDIYPEITELYSGYIETGLEEQVENLPAMEKTETEVQQKPEATEKPKEKSTKYTGAGNKKATPMEFDNLILELLSDGQRLSVQEIATRFGIPGNTVRRAFKRMTTSDPNLELRSGKAERKDTNNSSGKLPLHYWIEKTENTADDEPKEAETATNLLPHIDCALVYLARIIKAEIEDTTSREYPFGQIFNGIDFERLAQMQAGIKGATPEYINKLIETIVNVLNLIHQEETYGLINSALRSKLVDKPENLQPLQEFIEILMPIEEQEKTEVIEIVNKFLRSGEGGSSRTSIYIDQSTGLVVSQSEAAEIEHPTPHSS